VNAAHVRITSQYNPNPDPREEQLTDCRQRYEFIYSAVSPLAVIERIPVEYEFSLQWLKTVGDKVAIILQSQAAPVGEASRRRTVGKRRHSSRTGKPRRKRQRELGAGVTITSGVIIGLP
jgi:hypothetical protein